MISRYKGTRRASTPKGVARQAASQKVSRYMVGCSNYTCECHATPCIYGNNLRYMISLLHNDMQKNMPYLLIIKMPFVQKLASSCSNMHVYAVALKC